MSEFDLGRHEEAIYSLRADFNEFRTTVDGKLDKLLERDSEKRGEKRIIALVATAAGGVGSLLISLVMKLWGNS